MEANIPFFKFQIKESTKIDQIGMFLKIYCILNKIDLTPREREVFTYYIIHGVSPETKQLLRESGIITNEQSSKNILTRLKKFNFLLKTGKKNEYIVNKYFQTLNDNKVFGSLIKFEKEF